MAESPPKQESQQRGEGSAAAESTVTDHIPPWSEATFHDKVRVCTYTVLIYTPVAILVTLITAMGPLYFFLYFWPNVIGDDDRPELYYWHSHSEHVRSRVVGSICMGLETMFICMFVCSFYQAFATPPGAVPDTPEWRDIRIAEQNAAHMFSEKKHTNGAIRWCRRCSVVKPDRSHHCRLCDQCVLKMDHHCPWISNCVGFFNYKYFFLMLTYGMLGLWLFEATFWETALITWRDDERGTAFSFCVTVIFSLMFILMTAVTLFWSFHIHLIITAVTTIEYCEKHRKNPAAGKGSPYYRSVYESLQAALGKDPIYWLLPFKYRDCDENGLTFQQTAVSWPSSSEPELAPLAP